MQGRLGSLNSGLGPKCATQQTARSLTIMRQAPPPRPSPGYTPRPPPGGRGSGPKPDFMDLSRAPPADQFHRPRDDSPIGSYEALFPPLSGRGDNALFGRPPPGYRSRDGMDFDDDEEFNRRNPKNNYEVREVNGKPVILNEDIKATEVRVQGPAKEVLGVRNFDDVLEMAYADNMDVVLINGNETPPLVRIIAWNRFKFESEQKVKQVKAGSTALDVKEIRMKPRTDTNDLNVKVASALKFLKKGHKVKLSMKFEGRELQFRNAGKDVLLAFIQQIGTDAKVEGALNFKSAAYTVILSSEGA